MRETSSKPPEAQVARGGANPRRAAARGHRKAHGTILLFETAAGHALYELKHEEKLKKLDADKLASKLSEPRTRGKALSLKTFAPFRDTTEAVAAASDFVESKLNKQLKKFLKNKFRTGASSSE